MAITRALLSVSDKTGILDFAKGLEAAGVEILSTGGTAKHLKASAQGGDAVVQFLGRTERIARVHHLGLRDRVKPGGPEYDYPERPLMGFPQGYEDQLKDRILAHLAGR